MYCNFHQHHQNSKHDDYLYIIHVYVVCTHMQMYVKLQSINAYIVIPVARVSLLTRSSGEYWVYVLVSLVMVYQLLECICSRLTLRQKMFSFPWQFFHLLVIDYNSNLSMIISAVYITASYPIVDALSATAIVGIILGYVNAAWISVNAAWNSTLGITSKMKRIATAIITAFTICKFTFMNI